MDWQGSRQKNAKLRIAPNAGETSGPLMTIGRMKTIAVLSCLVLFRLTAGAMVCSDSRVVTLEELAREGIELDVRHSGRPTHRIFVAVRVLALDKTYQSMAFSVLDRIIDEDFKRNESRTKNLRDVRKWAREVRGSDTKKKTMTFFLSPDEVSRCYVVLNFSLPPKEGLPVFGTYYVLMAETGKKEYRSPEPSTTTAPRPSLRSDER